MRDITIYTTALCGFCHAAKRLLEQKGAEFREIDVTFEPSLRAEMAQRSKGARTVPQIFVGDTHVGGYDELSALESDGRLDALLAAQQR